MDTQISKNETDAGNLSPKTIRIKQKDLLRMDSKTPFHPKALLNVQLMFQRQLETYTFLCYQFDWKTIGF